MDGVDRAGLHGAEQFARRHELVGVVELDLHLALGGGVEHVDGGLGDVRAERGAGIGLQTPLDRRLRDDGGRRERRSRRRHRR